MTAECLRCGRPTPDGYVCSAEMAKAAAQLGEVRDMVGAARDIATGQARHGGTGGGGKPGSRLPFDLGATARLDAVERELGTWLRHVGEERGSATTVLVLLPDEDPIVVIAERLVQHLEWFRHRAEVDEFLVDMEACVRVVRGLARGPAPQRYLGPCGAPRWCCDRDEHPGHNEDPCDGDVYAREGASVGRCRVCSAEWSSATRQAWLDAEVRSWAYRASEIANAYGVNVKTIRSWADRGRLRTYWRTMAGLTVEWVEPKIADGLTDDERKARQVEIEWELVARGPKVFYLGEVLDLAAADAARREGDRATRARRSAARAAESETAA